MQDSYRELFLSESQEYLSIISNCLVKLEDKPADQTSLNEIFRCIHTLKGMSATMGFEKLTQLSHQMENLLDELRSGRKKVTTATIDVLFLTLDTLEKLTDDIRQKKDSKIDVSECLQALKNSLAVEGLSTEKESQPLTPPQSESIELNEEELSRLRQAKEEKYNVLKIKIIISSDCIMKQARAYIVISSLEKAGEIIKSSPALENIREGQFISSFIVVFVTKESQEDMRHLLLAISEVERVEVVSLEVSGKAAASAGQSPVGVVKKIQSMRIPVERLDKIMNLMGELAIAKIRLIQIAQSYKIDPLEDVSFVLDRLISSLQDEIMQTRLLPVAYILETFPRMVRDLAKRQNKELSLEVIGGEIELDRVVLDEISDPLVHLIRNAIDHGIETTQERLIAKKNPTAKLFIQISRQKGQIFIDIADDGKGVDFEAVKSVALNKGLLTVEEAAALDEKRVLDLITMPGFSTAKKVTDLSGRGVGLDVVKSKIEALGGRLEFETKLGVGSKFTLTLPLTLAIIKAMLVRVGQEIFAVPLMSVREIIKIDEKELKILQHFEVARVRDEIIPVLRLSKELEINIPIAEKSGIDDRLSVIIIEYGKRAMGLVVNQILGEQDIVVKPLGAIVKRTKGIAGATILGDGKVALILDTMSLR